MLCDLIRSRASVTHIDVSWSKLTPKHLYFISEALKENFANVRNLNLSYNSLRFKNYSLIQNEEDKAEASDESEEEVVEKGKTGEPMYSEEFVENMVAYFSNDDCMLNHVDLSGMSFNHDSLLSIATALSGNEMLQGIHLSDNGLRQREQKELMMEIMDLFIFDCNDTMFNKIEEFDHKVNQVIQNPNHLKQVIK